MSPKKESFIWKMKSRTKICKSAKLPIRWSRLHFRPLSDHLFLCPKRCCQLHHGQKSTTVESDPKICRKDFMTAEMKAISLSCNDPSHDGHAIHLPEPFSAVYGKSVTSADRISLVFACPVMEVNTTETFLLRCK